MSAASSAAASAASTAVSATAASPVTAAAAAPQPLVVKQVALTCVQALGPPPKVDSSAALSQLAAQLHVLTAPLPTAHSATALTALEDTVTQHLSHLDQFSTLLETLKHDTGYLKEDLLKVVTTKQEDLSLLFQQVHTFDKYSLELERYVSYVEGRTQEVEEILKKTQQMEVEYTRIRDGKSTGGAGGSGGPGAGMVQDLKQAEQAVTKLWSSLKNLGSKSSPAFAPNPPPTAGPDAPTMLDLVDAWVPFEPAPDIDEYFVSKKSAPAAAANE
jgi:hypothetical protein